MPSPSSRTSTAQPSAAEPVCGPVGRKPQVVAVAALGGNAAEGEQLLDPVLEVLVDRWRRNA